MEANDLNYFDLYSDVINEQVQQNEIEVEKECVVLRNQVQDAKIESSSLRENLQRQIIQYKQLMRNFYGLLTTARRDVAIRNEEICELSTKLNAPYITSCPSCESRFNVSASRPPNPSYVRVLRGRNCVELQFRNYELLRTWIEGYGLTENSDGLPTLPDQLEKNQNQSQPPTLSNTNSALMNISHCKSIPKKSEVITKDKDHSKKDTNLKNSDRKTESAPRTRTQSKHDTDNRLSSSSQGRNRRYDSPPRTRNQAHSGEGSRNRTPPLRRSPRKHATTRTNDYYDKREKEKNKELDRRRDRRKEEESKRKSRNRSPVRKREEYKEKTKPMDTRKRSRDRRIESSDTSDTKTSRKQIKEEIIEKRENETTKRKRDEKETTSDCRSTKRRKVSSPETNSLTSKTDHELEVLLNEKNKLLKELEIEKNSAEPATCDTMHKTNGIENRIESSHVIDEENSLSPVFGDQHSPVFSPKTITAAVVPSTLNNETSFVDSNGDHSHSAESILDIMSLDTFISPLKIPIVQQTQTSLTPTSLTFCSPAQTLQSQCSPALSADAHINCSPIRSPLRQLHRSNSIPPTPGRSPTGKSPFIHSSPIAKVSPQKQRRVSPLKLKKWKLSGKLLAMHNERMLESQSQSDNEEETDTESSGDDEQQLLGLNFPNTPDNRSNVWLNSLNKFSSRSEQPNKSSLSKSNGNASQERSDKSITSRPVIEECKKKSDETPNAKANEDCMKRQRRNLWLTSLQKHKI